MAGGTDAARVAYLLIAHEDPVVVAARVSEVVGYDPDGMVVVHYDRNAPAAAFRELKRALRDVPEAHLLETRTASGWGRFGLVEACINGLRWLAAQNAEIDFVHLLSASCAPIQAIGGFKSFLAAHRGTDFIEFAGPDWVIGGLREERWTLHHPFDERRHRWWFNRSVQLQRLLGVKRRPPDRIRPRLGSQWWTLSWPTCRALLAYLDAHPEVVRFFRTVWIADECFFQSLVPHLVPAECLPRHNLTFYQFSNQGKPLVFCEDHFGFLTHQPFFFARKISPEARGLRLRLVARARGDAAPPQPIGQRSVAYAARMRANSAYPVPGQLFFGSQIADEHAGLLGAGATPYVAILGAAWMIERVAQRLPPDIPTLRLPLPADASPALQLLGKLAPAQVLARHARAAAGEAVALLALDLPAAFIEAVRHDPNARVVVALPAVGAGADPDVLLRLADVAGDRALVRRLAEDTALHELPLAAVLAALTDECPSSVVSHRWLAPADAKAPQRELPPAVAAALEAACGDDALDALMAALPPSLAEAGRRALALDPRPAARRLAG
jgi:hypothetical protein